jgi:hypothetical protein
MGRMSAYTGKRVTWQQAHDSTEELMPNLLTWQDQAPKSEISIPGVTKFS